MKKLSVVVIILCMGLKLFAQESRNDIDFASEDAAREAMERKQYHLTTTYRVEFGYQQDWQHSRTDSYVEVYLHGGRIGATVDFNLPYRFSVQTGLYYSLTYGTNSQHWRNMDTVSSNATEQIVKHRIIKQTLTVPLRATYRQPIWKDLSLFFYAGPEFVVGVAQKDDIHTRLNPATRKWLESHDIHTSAYDRYAEKELYRFDVQIGLGGGLEWKNYRLQSGYNFGLNNLARKHGSHEWDWGWYVGVNYAF